MTTPPKQLVELNLSQGVTSKDPRMAGPPLPSDGRKKPTERLCMKAQHLVIETDGTLAGTTITVDGVQMGGLVRLELGVQKGYPRVSATVEQTYVREEIPEYGENAGVEVKTDNGNPATILVDIFKRS